MFWLSIFISPFFMHKLGVRALSKPEPISYIFVSYATVLFGEQKTICFSGGFLSQIRGHESEMPMPPTTFASFVCQKFNRIFLSELLL